MIGLHACSNLRTWQARTFMRSHAICNLLDFNPGLASYHPSGHLETSWNILKLKLQKQFVWQEGWHTSKSIACGTGLTMASRIATSYDKGAHLLRNHTLKLASLSHASYSSRGCMKPSCSWPKLSVTWMIEGASTPQFFRATSGKWKKLHLKMETNGKRGEV